MHTIKVTNTDDSTPDGIHGSLRYAINQANSSSNSQTIIKFSSKLCGKTIYLTQGELLVESNIKIISPIDIKIKVASGYQNRIFHIESPQTSFEIQSNCETTIKLEHGTAFDYGGGIYSESATVILKNVIIKKCSALNGGGIYINGDLFMSNCSIEKNSAQTQGGGIWSGKNITMVNSHVDSNAVTQIDSLNFGGGIVIQSGNLVMNKSSVSHNLVQLNSSVGGTGGGIYVASGSIYIQNESHVDHNSAFASGGIQEGKGDVNILDHSTVDHNKSTTPADASGGGGITIVAGNVVIDQSSVSYNKTNGMYSGGIVSLLGNVNINNSIISNNLNSGPGGGVACNFDCDLIIENSKIVNNTGASLGGGVINFSDLDGQVYISNSCISNNTLTNIQTIGETLEVFLSIIVNMLFNLSNQINTFPTVVQDLQDKIEEIYALIPDRQIKFSEVSQKLIYSFGDILNNATGGGGVATLLNCPLSILQNSKISQNFVSKKVSNKDLCGFGGGVFSTNSHITIQDSSICDNRIIGLGGGIFNDSVVELGNSSISHNNVSTSKLVESNGGGIYNNINGNVTSTYTKIKNNQTDKFGGGIFNADNAQLQLVKTLITENKAGKSGGGIYSLNQIVTLETLVKENKPNNIIIV